MGVQGCVIGPRYTDSNVLFLKTIHDRFLNNIPRPMTQMTRALFEMNTSVFKLTFLKARVGAKNVTLKYVKLN